MRALVMHETQEPKKGVGAGETVEFFPLTPTQTYAVSSRVVLPVPAAKETASSSLHCVPDLKPIARPHEN